jgi:hypothetical protein
MNKKIKEAIIAISNIEKYITNLSNKKIRMINVKNGLPNEGALVIATGLDYGKGPERHYAILIFLDGKFKSDEVDEEDWSHITHWAPFSPDMLELLD